MNAIGPGRAAGPVRRSAHVASTAATRQNAAIDSAATVPARDGGEHPESVPHDGHSRQGPASRKGRDTCSLAARDGRSITVGPGSVCPRPAPPNREAPGWSPPLPRQVRPAGLLLTLGATAWAIGTLIVGDKIYEGIQTLDTVTGMLFVVGVFAWIVVVARQRAGGRG